MTAPRIDSELRTLVEALVNGEASEAQVADLEARLLASECARDFYLDYVNLHSTLRRTFLAGDDAQAAAVELTEFRRAAAVESLASIRPRWRVRLGLVTATAAMLVAAVFLWQQFSTAEPHRVAVILALDGEGSLETSQKSFPAKVGDRLRAGSTLRVESDSGRITLEYSDGTRVMLNSDCVVQCPADGDVTLRLLGGSMEVDAAQQSADRPLIFATDRSRYVVLGTRFRLYHQAEASRLELDEGKVRVERPAQKEVVEVTAGNVAITTDDATPLEVIPLASGSAELLHSIRQGGQHVAFGSDEETLAASNFSKGLRVFSLSDAVLQSEYQPDRGGSDGLAFGDDDRTLVQVNRNGYILAWTIGTEKGLRIDLPGQKARSRAISPDGLVAAESSDAGTYVYDIDVSQERLHERFQRDEDEKAWCLALSRGGERLAAGYWNGDVRVYAVDRAEVIFETKLRHTPTFIALTDRGEQLAVFNQQDGLLRIDVTTKKQIEVWPGGTAQVRCLRFSSDGRYLLAGLNDRTARIWNAADGKELLVVNAGHSPQGIDWLEEKQLLATADGAVKLWKCQFDITAAASSRGDK